MPHILYLAHDLNDPAVCRRVVMLTTGGACVTLAGFRRGENRAETIAGVSPIDLGPTLDGKFVQRAGAVARAMLSLKRLLGHIAKPDIIIGRNLEMLAIAHRANVVFGGALPVVYECLDIHRQLLRHDMVGTIVRKGEAYFGREAKLILTSSPAFIDHYFRPVSALRAPIMLVENKVILLDDLADLDPSDRSSASPAGPWKIGWFGALRCRKSLQLLAGFSRAMQGQFEIVLRGRPAQNQFDDFNTIVAGEPYVSFLGPYKNPQELQVIYGDVHFSWAIDFFEEGLNSSWLLPNRLYEGCLYGAVPIAMEGTETARFLGREMIGLCLRDATSAGLAARLSQIDAHTVAQLRQAVASKSRSNWISSRDDCVAFVRRLMEISTLQSPQRQLGSLFSERVTSNGEPI